MKFAFVKVSIIYFGKRIKPTSLRYFLGNTNGPLYALKNFSRYTSANYYKDINREFSDRKSSRTFRKSSQ